MVQAGQAQRPVIGITGNFGDKGCELAQAYYQSVLQAGGIPLVIPPYEVEAGKGEDHTPLFADPVEETLSRTLDSVDALLLSGGGDLNPLLLGEQPIPALHGICAERDAQEMWLVKHLQGHPSALGGTGRAQFPGYLYTARRPAHAEAQSGYAP